MFPNCGSSSAIIDFILLCLLECLLMPSLVLRPSFTQDRTVSDLYSNISSMCAVPSSAAFFNVFWRFLCSLRFLVRFLLSLARFSVTFPRLRFAFSSSLSSGLTANLAMDAPSLISPENSQAVFWTFSSTLDWSWFLPFVFSWLSLPPQPALAAHSLKQRTLCGHILPLLPQR